MNKQLVRGPGGEQMVLVPEAEYDALVEAAEDLDDLMAMAEFDRKLKAGEEEFIPAKFADRMIDGENLIRVWRDFRGLSVAQLADKAKLRREEVEAIERDQHEPSIQNLKLIAEALKVTIDDLVR